MKKAYLFKMKLIPANLLAIAIFIIMMTITYSCFGIYFSPLELEISMILIVFWFILHELFHGLGFYLTGVKRKNIKYGIALEKGILYTMALQEVSKKGILVSLQMPFMVIGVITYIIGVCFNLNILTFLSIANITGAALDIVMFFYIATIKDIIYSETGKPDEFVLITKKDLQKQKHLFLEVKEVKEYKKQDYKFDIDKRITVSKRSLISAIVFILAFVILALITYLS